MRKFLLAYTMLAALGAPAMADPFVSGSEPGWGKHMSAQQRRAIDDDDVRTALKHNRKPDASPSGVAAITPTSGVLGYAFNLITIKDSGGFGQILSEPFGVFATLQECDMARAQKIAELGSARLLHQDPDAPDIITHFRDGSSVTQQAPAKKRTDVTFCESGTYSPDLNPKIVPYKPAPGPSLPKPDRTRRVER
jgi:hypothetical protein